MKPYYEDSAVTIYHGAALEVMHELDRAGVLINSVVTDPPYNSPDIGQRHRQYDGYDPMSDSDYRLWCERWYHIASRLSPNVAFTPGIKNVWNYPPAKWMLCWSKPSSPSFSSLGGYNVWEPILIYGKPAGRFIHDLIEQVHDNSRKGPWTEHPCPKPERLWRWLVSHMAEPGDVVLDPFLGSGTTARVCKDFGVKCIGIEQSEQYCEMAAQRMAQQVMAL